MREVLRGFRPVGAKTLALQLQTPDIVTKLGFIPKFHNKPKRTESYSFRLYCRKKRGQRDPCNPNIQILMSEGVWTCRPPVIRHNHIREGFGESHFRRLAVNIKVNNGVSEEVKFRKNIFDENWCKECGKENCILRQHQVRVRKKQIYVADKEVQTEEAIATQLNNWLIFSPCKNSFFLAKFF